MRYPLHLCVMALLCLPCSILLSAMNVNVNVYAVGQGNAVLVKGGGHVMLIDAGSSASRLTALVHNRALKKQGSDVHGKKKYTLYEDADDVPPTQQTSEGFEHATPESHTESGSSAPSDRSSQSPPPNPTTAQPERHNKRKREGDHNEGPEQKRRRYEQRVKEKKAKHEKERVKYMQDIFLKIRSELPDDKKPRPKPKASKKGKGAQKKKAQNPLPNRYLQTVVVTHPDKDHYNLIPKLLAPKMNVRIGNIVLSGFWEDYNETFQKWLVAINNANLLDHKPLFTGTRRTDGKWLDGATTEGVARAYNSYLPSRTEQEKKIEKALQIFGGTPHSQGDTPFFEILSMNAGHAQTERAVLPTNTEQSDTAPMDVSASEPVFYRANMGSNANSLVLKLTVPRIRDTQEDGRKESRFVFSGDATRETWGHIYTSFSGILKENPAFLRTDYLLLSHHGSPHEGCTHEKMIELFAPKACLVSVGRHQSYHHPGKATLEMLLSKKGLLWHTAPHTASYFGKRPNATKDDPLLLRRIDDVQKAFFSTFSSGDMQVALHEDFAVHTTYAKTSSYSMFADNKQKVFLGKLYIRPGSVITVPKEQKLSDAFDVLEDDAEEDEETTVVWTKRTQKKQSFLAPHPQTYRPKKPYTQREDFADLPLRHFLYNRQKRQLTPLDALYTPDIEED